VLCAGEWESGAAYYNGRADSTYHGIPVTRVNLNWTKAPDTFTYLYDNPWSAKFLSELIQTERPDVVHVMSCETLSASVLRATKELGISLVLSLTDFWFLCPRINLLRSDGQNCDARTTGAECLECMARGAKVYEWAQMLLPRAVVPKVLAGVARVPVLTRQRGVRGLVGDVERRKAFLRTALTWPDVRLTASPFVRRVHCESGIDAPIEVSPYGHDLSWLANYKGKSSSAKVRVGYVGQILPSKGVHLILEAAGRLPPDLAARLSLVIFGDLEKSPEYGARLRSLAAGLPDVQFCGTYKHEDSASVYSSFDVLAVPSLWFDFPLVIHEALATRTPVIATNLGGMAEAVADGENGFLFEPGDVQQLERHLERLVTERSLIAELSSKIGSVRTLEQEGDALDALYHSLA
jgi:glycosyltransferase involved in cell wall biosynthesis